MISPNKTQSVTKVSPKTYQPTVPTVTSASKDAKWTSYDDEVYCASRIFPGSSFVSDFDMQQHTRDNLKVTCPGTPDATVFEGGTTLEGDVWNVKCLQVCRGYSRKHVNAMIAEKLYKSAIWLSTLSSIKPSLSCSTFTIALLVRPTLHLAALRIASYANVLLNDTVFDIRIIEAPLRAVMAMTDSNVRKGSLLAKRKYISASLVLKALEDGRSSAKEGGLNFDDDDQCSYELLFVIFEL